jgi:origin recognition complex subunit 1
MSHKSTIPPSRVQLNTKAARARRLLSGATPRENSDDELGYEDHPWQWVYEGQESRAAGQNDTTDDFNEQADDGASGSIARRRSKSVRTTSRSYDQKIIGARMGNFECKLGDCVLLKAEGEGNKAWMAIICEFGEDENGEMGANVMCRYGATKITDSMAY